MNWKRIGLSRAMLAPVLLASQTSAQAYANIIVPGDLSDAVLRKDGSRLMGTATGRVGAGTSFFAAQQGGRDAVYVFRLPSPTVGDEPIVARASFGFTIVSDQPDGDFNIDLYGLGARAEPTVLARDYYSGASDSSDATLIEKAIVSSIHPDRGIEAVTTDPQNETRLVDYLNAQYRSAGAGQYVFLRLCPDREPINQDSGVDVAFAERGDGAPQLTIAFPEPCGTWAVLVFCGLLRRRRAK
jgi:hypothetical protein